MHDRMLCTVAAIVVAIGLAPRIARAAVIEADGYASWDDAVRALERDTRSEGTVLYVRVRDAEQRAVACNRYALELDAVGASAFAIEGCDASTDATALRLVHRDALFVAADPVPEPREVELRATVSESTSAIGGGGETAGRELHCVASVRPYLMDLQHGTRLDLEPGRYVVRPLSQDVQAEPAQSGWTLIGPAGATARVEYEVIDTWRNVTVLHDETTLACRDTAVDAMAGVLAATESTPSAIDFASSAAARARRTSIISSSFLGIGPGLAGTVFLVLGILLQPSDHDLGTVYECLGPGMMLLGGGLTALTVTGAIRRAERQSEMIRQASRGHRPEFVSLSAGPTAGASGFAASAVFRF